MKSEADISREIQEYLTKNNYFWWRSQVFKGRVKGGFLHTGIKGLADITVMLKDKHLYIELKKPTTKQKKGQKEFEKKCLELGHYYIVVRSVEELHEYLKGYLAYENI